MSRKKQGVTEGGEASILLLVALIPVICSAGILDPWRWARSDRTDVNIPWLPCNYILSNPMYRTVRLIYFIYYYRDFTLLVENETRCYDELGCLNITRSWYHLTHRPLNVFPLPREVINTKFILYTNDNNVEVSTTVHIYDYNNFTGFSHSFFYRFLFNGIFFPSFHRARPCQPRKTSRLNGRTSIQRGKQNSLYTGS